MRTTYQILTATLVAVGLSWGCGKDEPDDSAPEGDTDSDSDVDSDTDSDSDVDADADTDADTDTDTDPGDASVSGEVSLQGGLAGGSGMLCVGLFAGGCPDFTSGIPEPVVGAGFPDVTLDSASGPYAYSFVPDEELVTGTYGFGALLQIGDDDTDTCGQADPGDILGCTEAPLTAGTATEDVDIVLDMPVGGPP